MTKKKKILLVSNGFYPEISPRSYRVTELAKEYCRQGHEVTVITKYRNHNYSKFLNQHPIRLKMWGKSLKPVPSFSNRLGALFSSILTRLLLMFFEYPAIGDMFSVKKMLKYEEGYDLLISFAVPHPVHWGVAWSRSSTHPIAPTWVADCGDPYMGDVLDTYRKLFYFGYFEKWFGRKVDYIAIPIASAINAYYPEFKNKIRIISQGFQFDLKRNNNKCPNNPMPTFAYAGGFIAGVRDPQPLLQFLSTLDKPFKFLVYTNSHDMLNGYKEKLKGKLVVSGYIPRDELMEILPGMDFLVNFDNNTQLNSPSKLIDYAIVNRPVLNIGRDFKQQSILNFIKGDYTDAMPLPNPEEFHISHVSKQFIDLLKD
ncbi:hypothetical protein SAMN06265379_10238 [Saccharicrinis carchari]|uniref:Uncharacterized protein n=1 Tax=Saccharicrinis carchari TaxID=1168039 RepID=A0A521BU69_SACCC|nr:glycosyltransferase family 4 protein [Saccharicrinis carchari]SMO50020.1 hypothetical protein SAMN06265379_10238 [Saccharicrinis carchari]